MSSSHPEKSGISIALHTDEIIKWNEPIWAAPNKPRGKRDKIGEQEVTGKIISVSETIEFKVISVKKISTDDSQLSVAEGDVIKRKKLSLEKGNGQKVDL